MNKTIKKLSAIALSLIVIFTCTACAQSSEEKHEYSVGLTEDGFYENLTEMNIETPNISAMEISATDVLNWGVKDVAMATELGAAFTLDDYLTMYGNSFLTEIGLASKETAEESDLVNVDLLFYDKDGKEMPEYTQSGESFIATKDGDAITSSFLGHKPGDGYELQYTFPAEDAYLANETVTVHVIVNGVNYADPLSNNVVENNLELLSTLLGNVTDVDSYKESLKPFMVQYHLTGYVENQIATMDIEVPEKFIDFEVSRLKSRLSSIGYTYNDYKKDTQMTDDDIRAACTEAARENLITMLLYSAKNEPFTKEDLLAKYGQEDYDYYVMMQGEPYVKLRNMREVVLIDIVNNVVVKDDNGQILDFSALKSMLNVDNAETEVEAEAVETTPSEE